MSLKTRIPTGLPPWPIMLIAGSEKSGKSWACAVASGSDLIGDTYWITVGEDQPDEYGAIPGSRFMIVEHDGTYRGILNALIDASREKGDKPSLLILDSGTRLWNLLGDMAQAEANERAIRKARKARQPEPDDDVTIGPDLWNVAKSRWQNVLDVLRQHNGPSIITARLDLVMIMDRAGNPTKDKQLKIQAEKGLAYDVGVVVELPNRGDAFLTGVRSVKLSEKSEARTKLPNFTVDKLWRQMGLAEKNATAPRDFHSGDGAHSLDAERQLITDRAALLSRLADAVPDRAKVAAEWHKDQGHPISETTDLDSLTALVVYHEAEKEAAA